MAEIEIRRLRKRLGYNQAEMGSRMGLCSRAYFTLEQDPNSINSRHEMVLLMVSLQEAVERGDRSLADPAVASLADSFGRLPRQPGSGAEPQ
ncbi:MAG: hypothetical protein FWD68_21835 [Alphaproteobacteria bacterium]|nr:hypothetical protein [Alphaproteobacteria bacterium]